MRRAAGELAGGDRPEALPPTLWIGDPAPYVEDDLVAMLGTVPAQHAPHPQPALITAFLSRVALACQPIDAQPSRWRSALTGQAKMAFSTADSGLYQYHHIKRNT